MSLGLLTLFMFGVMLLLLATGLPMVFVLGGVSVLFGYFAWGIPLAVYFRVRGDTAWPTDESAHLFHQ